MTDTPTGKAPAFQFYTGDYLKDPAVRSVSLAARGLWMDMICLMWESHHRGYLEHPNGVPVTTDQLCRMVGSPKPQVTKLLEELSGSGVYSLDNRGVIYCRRMVRDEHKRELCREAGKKGGNPALKGGDKGKDNPIPEPPLDAPLDRPLAGPDNPNPTPSSSSSSSSSDFISSDLNTSENDMRMDRWDLDETYAPIVQMWGAFMGEFAIPDDYRTAHFYWRNLDWTQQQERINRLREHVEVADPQYTPKLLKWMQTDWQRKPRQRKEGDNEFRYKISGGL